MLAALFVFQSQTHLQSPEDRIFWTDPRSSTVVEWNPYKPAIRRIHPVKSNWKSTPSLSYVEWCEATYLPGQSHWMIFTDKLTIVRPTNLNVREYGSGLSFGFRGNKVINISNQGTQQWLEWGKLRRQLNIKNCTAKAISQNGDFMMIVDNDRFLHTLVKVNSDLSTSVVCKLPQINLGSDSRAWLKTLSSHELIYYDGAGQGRGVIWRIRLRPSFDAVVNRIGDLSCFSPTCVIATGNFVFVQGLGAGRDYKLSKIGPGKRQLWSFDTWIHPFKISENGYVRFLTAQKVN